MQPLFHASQVIFVQFTDTDDDRRFASRILFVSEEEELWISTPTLRDEDGEQEVLLDPGTTILLEVLRPDGIRRFPTVVRKRTPGSPSTLVVDWPKNIERIQRRNDVRVDVSLPVELEPLERVAGVARRIEATTMDLSAGGLRVRIQERIPATVQMRVRLKLPDRDPLLAHGQVLRVHAVNEQTDAAWFWAAIRFTTIDERDRQEIARAVFHFQREALRKGNL